MPFAATGRSKPHPTTAATSHSARTNHVSVPTPACLLASAASPSTSSSQTRPAPSARTATAPLSRASITCLKSWRFHSVEQPCFTNTVVGSQIDLFMFHRPSKALDKNVVAPGAAAIHAHGDRVLQQQPGERRTGELASLIGIENFGPSVTGESLLHCFEAEIDVHRDRQPPRKDPPAEPI